MFSEAVLEKLGAYVYRLIDPRTRETFYVGKGTGQRVFSHLQLEIGEANQLGTAIDEASGRLGRIREIFADGLTPQIVIHRHGMSDEVALHVEASLIDVFSQLTNIQAGHGSGSFGPQTVGELEEKYSLRPTPLTRADLRFLLVFVNKQWQPEMTPDQVYYAAHFAWGVNKQRAEACNYILAVSRGIVRGCFIATEWLKADQQGFPDRKPVPGRLGFIGEPATDVWDQYVPTRVPDEAMPQGQGPTSFCYWPRR